MAQLAPLLFPWADFLHSYPHPAFILQRDSTSNTNSSLKPLWSNSAYYSFLSAVHDEQSAITPSQFSPLEKYANLSLGQAFCSPDDLVRFASWVGRGDYTTFRTRWRPGSWTVSSDTPEFILVKTILEDYMLITSTPLTTVQLPPRGSQSHKRAKSRRSPKRDAGLKIDMPPPSVLSSASSSSVTLRAHYLSTPSPVTPLVPAPVPDGSMSRLISAFDWSSTCLGPISSWPQSLISSLSFILAAPYPGALWWGPSLVLLYNDGYARMSGNKHPAMLGLEGLVSWRELNWDVLGPLTERVMQKGEAVAKTDDLLFFDKMGDEMLPEETYHCWSWTPVKREDGQVGGMINFTFESTQKVIAERRMDVLREIGLRTPLCKNEQEFAKSVIGTLSKNSVDAPFIALYTCSTNLTETPRTPHLDDGRQSFPFSPVGNDFVAAGLRNRAISALSPLRVDLKLIGKFNVEAPAEKGDKEETKENPSLPRDLTLNVDPLALRFNPSYAASITAAGSVQGLTPIQAQAQGGGLARVSSKYTKGSSRESVSLQSHTYTGVGLGIGNYGHLRDSPSSGTNSGSGMSASGDVTPTPPIAPLPRAVVPALHSLQVPSLEHSSANPSIGSSAQAKNVSEEHPPFQWPFQDCFVSRAVKYVENLPEYVIPQSSTRKGDSLESKVAWGDPIREALLIPIAPKGEDLPSAVLVMGCNPRRPYDEDYSTWVDVLQSSLSNGWEAAKARSEEIQRAAQLQSLDAAKSAFFSNASHELRTPLTLILSPLEDVVGCLSDPKAEFMGPETEIDAALQKRKRNQEDYNALTLSPSVRKTLKSSLKLAIRNASRLRRLVDSLMDFSRLEAGRLHGRFKPINLSAFTLDLASMFRSTIEKQGIEYVTECGLQDKKICYVDPELWEKICFNLIGNAYKYTMEGSIHVQLEYMDQELRLSVRDTGVGISKADLPKIGRRFHRVSTQCRSIEGTGIGLSLTKELVKLHGGTFLVESATVAESSDGRHGSVFSVTLPLGCNHLPRSMIDDTLKPWELPAKSKYAQSMVDEARQWGGVSSGLAEDATTPSDSSDSIGSGSEGFRLDPSVLFFAKSDLIMIVDDNVEMRRYVKTLFTPFCRVVEASNGREALDLLAQHTPDVIVCDRMMPFIDGFQLLESIKQDPVASLIPIILLTAQAADEAKVDGLLRGFDDYLSKPFRGRELIARVHLQMQLGKKRRQLEVAFLEHTREIKLLADLSPVGICRTDTEGRITYTNSRYHELTGIEETNGNALSCWLGHIHPEDIRRAEQLWHAALDDNQVGHGEFRWKNDIWTQIHLEVIYIQNEKFVGMLGTLTDISERKNQEASELLSSKEREHEARRRLEEAELRRVEADERRRSQELLIDVTSHELRQPVSAILNCSSLVRSNLAALRGQLQSSLNEGSEFRLTHDLVKVIDEDLDALDAIYQCGLAQERIANDVLSLSRIQLQVLTIHPIDFDLIPEVERIVAVFRNEVKMKRINLSLSVSSSLKQLGITRVKTDKARFAQVITNLLSNAIKFTDMSSSKRRIAVTLELSPLPAPDGPCVPPPLLKDHMYDWSQPKPVYIFVSVKDSGPGLKPGDLALLFRRFAQGSNSHEVFGGSGLGLFVSRQLCELMNGRIDVDSVYGKGATFRFFIEALSSDPAGALRPVLGRTYSSERARHGAARRQLHILVTEDNLINQTVLNRQLKKEGCTTEVANHGAQAIERLLKLAQKEPDAEGPRQFDAIFMDCEMPVMDGYSAVREIRKMEELGQLPNRNLIFALTGNAREGQVESARAAGMDDVFIKPYKIKELMARLRSSA